MSLGDFLVIKEEVTDVEIARFILNADPGARPVVGEEVLHDGLFYRVRNVRHLPDPENRSTRPKMVAAVYIREGEGRKPPAPPAGPRTWGKPKLPTTHHRMARVLEFVLPDPAKPVASFLLPPSLIMAILREAYTRQEFEYARAKTGTYIVNDGGGTWVTVTVGDDPRGLSNKAGRALLDLSLFTTTRLTGREPVSIVRGHYVPHALPPETLASVPTISDAEASTANERPPGEPRRPRLPVAAPEPTQTVSDTVETVSQSESEAEAPHLRLVRQG